MDHVSNVTTPRGPLIHERNERITVHVLFALAIFINPGDATLVAHGAGRQKGAEGQRGKAVLAGLGVGWWVWLVGGSGGWLVASTCLPARTDGPWELQNACPLTRMGPGSVKMLVR